MIPVVGAMRLELLAGGYVQADEIPTPCQTGEKLGRNHRVFVWESSRPRSLVVFDFRMGRSRAGPGAFLRGFRGRLQSDGYRVYANLGEGIVYVGCGVPPSENRKATRWASFITIRSRHPCPA